LPGTAATSIRRSPASWTSSFQRESHARHGRRAERLERLGVLVKDLDSGLVDFPRRSTKARKCSSAGRSGEDEVAHWHGVDEGLRGQETPPVRITTYPVSHHSWTRPDRLRGGAARHPGRRLAGRSAAWRARDLPAETLTRLTRILRRTILTLIVFVGVPLGAARDPAGGGRSRRGSWASSAVIGIVVGFAAQRTIGNFIRGPADRVLRSRFRIGD